MAIRDKRSGGLICLLDLRNGGAADIVFDSCVSRLGSCVSGLGSRDKEDFH